MESVTEKTALINVGNMPQTAQEIHDFVKTALVVQGTPLKEKSLDLHKQVAEALPAKWEDWGIEDAELASMLYDSISDHISIVTNTKGNTALDIIKDKAHKLHKGITAAVKDILDQCPADKETLMGQIRKWRKRKEEAELAEANRLAEIARKEAEERQLHEAIEAEKEGNTEEAEKILEEIPFVPTPVVKTEVPKGGPNRITLWKFEVVDFAKLPDKYKIADEKKIRSIVNTDKDKADIPGVKVWSE